MLELDQMRAQVAHQHADPQLGEDCRPVDDLQPLRSRAQQLSLLMSLRRSHHTESSLHYRTMSEVIGPTPSLTPSRRCRDNFVAQAEAGQLLCASMT
jgi:hypothetical protein